MWCFTVYDNESHALCSLIKNGLKTQGIACVLWDERKNQSLRAANPFIALLAAGTADGSRFINPDAVIISTDAAFYPNETVNCKKAVLPGGFPADCLDRIHAESIVTYGMGESDSLSVSAMQVKPVLSLRREIVSLDGIVSEIQEIPLHAHVFPEFGLVMAATAAFLISGIPARKIPDIWSQNI